jgi:hypothetical protein
MPKDHANDYVEGLAGDEQMQAMLMAAIAKELDESLRAGKLPLDYLRLHKRYCPLLSDIPDSLSFALNDWQDLHDQFLLNKAVDSSNFPSLKGQVGSAMRRTPEAETIQHLFSAHRWARVEMNTKLIAEAIGAMNPAMRGTLKNQPYDIMQTFSRTSIAQGDQKYHQNQLTAYAEALGEALDAIFECGYTTRIKHPLTFRSVMYPRVVELARSGQPLRILDLCSPPMANTISLLQRLGSASVLSDSLAHNKHPDEFMRWDNRIAYGCVDNHDDPSTTLFFAPSWVFPYFLQNPMPHPRGVTGPLFHVATIPTLSLNDSVFVMTSDANHIVRTEKDLERFSKLATHLTEVCCLLTLISLCVPSKQGIYRPLWMSTTGSVAMGRLMNPFSYLSATGKDDFF